jgi:rod shape-determining protein MreC
VKAIKPIFTQAPSQFAQLILALLVSLALIVVDYRYQHLQQARATLAFIVYPLHFLADLPVRTSLQFQQWSASRTQLMDENQQLHRVNLKLKAELQKYVALQAENIRLRNLLDSSLKVGDRVLIAELSAVDLDPYRQQVIINKGSASGAFTGQPVLDAAAVMGQVIETTQFSSTVLLITDATHSIPIQILRNGLRTIAVGSGRVNELQLPYLPTDSDILVGDLLVTSGLGGKFPPGYPVARVTHINRAPNNAFAEITAQPAAHLDRSREVLLVWTMHAHTNGLTEEVE